MKCYVIYVSDHEGSISQMQQCLKSCKKFNYPVSPFAGSTPRKMLGGVNVPAMENARVRIFEKENYKKYEAKKACFSNHIRLWKECIKSNETLVVLEHDAFAVKAWDNPKFEDVLVMNIGSAFGRSIFNSTRPGLEFYKEGINKLEGTKLTYKLDNIYKGSYMIPGTASYAITPQGAEKLLKALETHGWEQSDYFINTHNVDIRYSAPDYFKLNPNNLHLSHG